MAAPITRIPPKREQMLDRRQNAIQSNARETARQVNLRGSPPVVIGPIVFTALQEIELPHGLMRVPEEWYAIDVLGSFGAFYRVAWNDRTITIRSGNACTATFKVA